jgi:disulfide bond formation protein DsbB
MNLLITAMGLIIVAAICLLIYEENRRTKPIMKFLGIYGTILGIMGIIAIILYVFKNL